MRTELWLVALLAGCGPSTPHQPRAQGTPVLRAVYRDGAHHLLVVLPDDQRRVPHGDCAAPLLIDDATGGARQITPAQARQAMGRMQLSGAVPGTCP